MASSGNVILRAPDDKEFLLAELDDLALEAAMVRQQPELMEFLAQHSNAGSRSSLKQVRETLGKRIPYVKYYFIRLSPWVVDDQPLLRIRMQDSGGGKPAVNQTTHPHPRPATPLLAAAP